MRLSVPFALALGSLTSQVSARFHHDHLEKRSTSDRCAYLSTALTFVPVPGAPPTVLGTISSCVCISTIPTFLETNAVATALVTVIGSAGATAQLTSLVNSQGYMCQYPDHSQPACFAGNVCNFDCANGFSYSGNSAGGYCRCSSPKIECNGVCGDFGATCPSSEPVPVLPIRKRSLMCDDGLTACGIDGWSRRPASDAWECIDTQNDLESCGGCAVPLTLTQARGVDCTNIPHVADVACTGGSCVVRECDRGYTPSFDKTYCVPVKPQSSEEIMAAAYGLEHQPLKRTDTL